MWVAMVALVGAVAVPSGSPQPLFKGGETSLAVERATGRVALFRAGTIEILPDVSAQAPTQALVAPDGPVHLVEFCDDTVAYAFTMPDGGGGAMAAVLTSGLERLIWPNTGIGPVFPDLASRLTADAGGVYSFLPLDAALREELGVPADIPDGAGTVATFRFADDTLYGLASTDFTGAVALAPRDLVIALKGGGLMRYRSPGGEVWRHDRRTGAHWVIADVDAAADSVLVVSNREALEAFSLESGAPRWRADAGMLGRALRAMEVSGRDGAIVDARLLHDGRVLLLGGSTGRWLAVVDPAARAATGDLLTGAGPLGRVVRSWAARHGDLSEAFEASAAGRPVLLVQGEDGWYALPLGASGTS